ncbi:tripartite tricarboxylate transporter substrate binding protein [Rhodovulum sulfidophilum]|uniref:tripartite tricarboxylate transporter substrate binding protein n=1 Tax=Rhodovulum sulfidophilum TaxID=35806 RepID=UPI00095367BE|nr:tripartite tricarboxylate transporter substrate binding protein [Rhodovulum sulfidophilum]MBL3552201.1 tripartite tricarboxylate transporter substrate binding protein [Rhodovulum sulfidophilum]MBL3559699.1 tripartite tricarboxylate transporter substrate binding protein [Rhodovulum sulfidophilum]MBL3564100.1 tripartite tricarboxylate transporter substrate binding protein [Rhodovulum sulfidophilum]NDK35007.1 tripartite tricarboxylate transporter substrate binding protein [Rhodovulum sulfidophi
MTRTKALIAGLSLTLAAGAAWAEFPDRPVQLIVPYPAGGGTDIVARTLAVELEKELGQPVNVVNRAGGGGIPGQTAIAHARPDGYTIGLIASDISLYKPQGLTDLTHADMTALGQTNELPGSVTVAADAPYRTMDDLVTAIRDNPATIKGTGAAPGASWHAGFLGLMFALDMAPDQVIWVPTQGGTKGHLDVAAGNSDFSTASLVEARALIEAGKLRPLATMAAERVAIFPEVPTLQEQGIDYTYGLWHGVTGPKDMDPAALEVLSAAVEKAANSDGFVATLEERGFKHVWRPGPEFEAFMAEDLAKMQAIFDRLND